MLGFFQVLNSVLLTKTNNVFDDRMLKGIELIDHAEVHGLDRHHLVVPAPDLKVGGF